MYTAPDSVCVVSQDLTNCWWKKQTFFSGRTRPEAARVSAAAGTAPTGYSKVKTAEMAR